MFLLAPSTRLDNAAYIKVANVLFEDKIALVNQARSLVFSSLYSYPTSTSTSQVTLTPDLKNFVKTSHEVNASFMINLAMKEACGIPLLGTIAMCLAKALTSVIPGHTFKAEMEFAVKDKLKKGVKPSCDGAVAALRSESNMPVLLFEYKPVVDTRIGYLDPHSLIETLIQGYYCLYQHELCSVVHCLTDMCQWYYFKLEKVRPSKLKVKWYHGIFENELNLQTHVYIQLFWTL